MATTPTPESTEEANKTLVQRWTDELWSNGDEAVAEELVASDSAFYDPASQGAIPATHEAHYAAYREAFPDMSFTIKEMVAEDDTVATRFTATGTHEGELFGLAPTNNSFEIDGIVITRIEDGQIVESWPVWDVFGLMNQLGLGGVS